MKKKTQAPSGTEPKKASDLGGGAEQEVKPKKKKEKEVVAEEPTPEPTPEPAPAEEAPVFTNEYPGESPV